MKVNGLVYWFLIIFPVCVFSQQMPIIKVGEKQIEVKKLEVQTEVIGDIAITIFDMHFYNPNRRVLEGELSFPLGEGQSVTRFALEINGNLREAVVIEKEKARVAFETTVRNKIDPALLEQTKGNNYKARIYPIPAKGYKRVVLAFQQKLSVHNNAYYYKLPFHFKNKLENFSFKMDVLNQKNKPVFQEGMLSHFNYNAYEDSYTAIINKKEETIAKPVLIKIPLNPNQEKLIANQGFFYYTKNIALPKRTVALENYITIFWDASLSQKDKKIKAEFSLLDKYFTTVQNCKVNLVIFNTVLKKNQNFTITKGDWSLLKTTLKNIIYDGASSFDAFSNYKDSSKANLLFTDGLNTLSDITISFPKKTFIINSALSANHLELKNIANKSGGAYLNINQKSIAKEFLKFTEENLQFLGTNFSEADIEVYPKKGAKILSNFSITGKGDISNKKVELKFGYGNTVLKTVSFKVKNNKNTNTIITKLWAQKRLESLLKDKNKNEKSIVELSKEYQIISPFTSMLILDRVEDYVAHKITPPKDLREKYDSLIAKQIDNRKDRFNNLQTNLFDSYLGFFNWYDTNFKTEPKLKKTTKTQSTISAVSRDTILPEGTFAVSGVIESSEDNLPIPGANIIIKGTARGVETDFDGNYRIDVKAGEILIFSSLGYESIETTIENTNRVNVSLAEDHNVLEEVVVVGYGTTRRSSRRSSRRGRRRANSVSSVETVSEVSRVDDALKSRVSGVNIQSNSRGEATEQAIQIRGVGSISGDSSPLIVVDGVVVDASFLANLDKNNLESMEVLKDASSTAIYGSRGANGVIMVTTKKGGANNTEAIKELNALVKEKIELKGWNPKTPYLKILNKTATIEEAYKKYLDLRKEYGNSPSFYVDVADFFKKKDEEIAIQILTNVVEIDLDNYELLKALAYKFEEYKLYNFAIFTYKEILKLRPEDIQSYRDLALAYEHNGAYQKSINLLYQIVNGEFLMKDENRRFSGVEIIALNEFNRMLSLYGSKLKTNHFNEKFIKSVQTDFRVVIDWNHNDTDIDLWVIDPNDEKCYYGHTKTAIGGLISDDMTNGFGPEQFVLKNAIAGKYTIKAKYYSNSQQKVSGPTFLKVTVFKSFGTKKEVKTTQLIRLKKSDDVLEIGDVVF